MNIYDRITEALINEMKQGRTPWRQAWSDPENAGGAGYISASTGRPYSLLNQILLRMSGKKPGEFLTFNQVKKAGGNVRRGSRAGYVCFYTIIEKKEERTDPETGEKYTVVVDRYPVLKGYNVFNVATDCEGVDPKHIPTEPEPTEPEDADEICERIINGYINNGGPELNILSTAQAFYDADEDRVICPRRDQYNAIGDYYCTIFHELTHSTGHASRLDRAAMKQGAAASGATRSTEELCAEIGAAYLCGVAGIENHQLTQKSAQYLNEWIQFLSNDKKAFAIAAAQAEKAVNFILSKSSEQ